MLSPQVRAEIRPIWLELRKLLSWNGRATLFRDVSCRLHERVLSFTQKAMISDGSILSRQESNLKKEWS